MTESTPNPDPSSLVDQMAQVAALGGEAPPATPAAAVQREYQMQANTALAHSMFATMAVYSLILPANRGSVDSLLDLTFAPLRIRHGPVPWVQCPARAHGLGIADPALVRDALYAQRFTGPMPPIKLMPFDDTEALERYIDTLEEQVELAATSNPHGYTFEEQNLTHLRLLAAHDLLMLRTADKTLGLDNAADTAEVMEKFRLSERALRALNAINRSKPDARPPTVLTSDPPTGWWFVLSDDLMVTYMLDKEMRLHRPKGGFVAKNDGRMNLMRTTPFSILAELQQRFGYPIDVLFPFAPADFGSLRTGRDRNRCISVGLLPLVMSMMDDRFLHLNPVRAVCNYVHNVVRTQLFTNAAPSLYYDASARQLSHNIDWCAQLDSTTESNVVYASHLYAAAHQTLMTRITSKQRAALVVCRDFIARVTDPATAQKVMELANTYGDRHATTMAKGQSVVAEFEENIFSETHHVLVKKPRATPANRKRAAPDATPTGAHTPPVKRARTADEDEEENLASTANNSMSGFPESIADDEDDGKEPAPVAMETAARKSPSPPKAPMRTLYIAVAGAPTPAANENTNWSWHGPTLNE